MSHNTAAENSQRRSPEGRAGRCSGGRAASAARRRDDAATRLAYLLFPDPEPPGASGVEAEPRVAPASGG